jgi:ADP-ribose pyrophosphatase YjhB (NUDIX family)
MTPRYCQRCGGHLDRRRVEPEGREQLVCSACATVTYRDPKVAAGTLFRMDGGVVLLQRGIEPSYGKWVFPGGYVDLGERVEDAAIRETREEVNVDVRISHLLNVYSYRDWPAIIIVYAAEVVGGTPQPGREALAVRAFPPAEIPWDALAFPSTTPAIREYVSRYF